MAQDNKEYPKSSILTSFLLHLIPGLLIVLIYIHFFGRFGYNNFPYRFEYYLSVLLVIVLFELGFLYYQCIKTYGFFSVDDIIFYRKRISLKYYVLFSVLFLLYGIFIVFYITPLLEDSVLKFFFNFIPSWYVNPVFTLTESKAILFITVILNLIVFGFLVPIIEGLYFRGYLLPRLSYLRGWGIIVHIFFFTLYILFTPWRILTIIFISVPAILIIRVKKNLYLGILLHVMVNLVGIILRIILIINK